MEPSPTAIPQREINIELAISALTYHFESQLQKRKSSSSVDEDMASYPRTQIFEGSRETPHFSLSSRTFSAGGDTPGRVSFPNFAGELSPTTPRRERTSRYLSEGARKEIIARIDNGEKQVALAKEFNVSRAAICNLYKNRWEVLTRGVRDPTATHPKKSHKKASLRQASPMTPTDPVPPPMVHTSLIAIQTVASPIVERAKTPSPFESEQDNSYPSWPGTQADVSQPRHHNQMRHRNILHDESAPRNRGSRDTMTVDDPGSSKQFIVHEASAYSYPCRNLVATLRDESISTVVFQQRAMRLARLLVEEVLACLPHDEEEITNKYGDLCHTIKALDSNDFCAISMEDKGMVLLRAFSDISPASPTGVVSVERKFVDSKLSPPHIFAQLPPINPQQFVLLLDIECATGRKVCAVLHHLVHDRHIAPGNIYFVTVISAFEGLQNVFRHFPDVSLATAQVDTVLDDQQHIRPGIGDFAQRYWNVNS
ncbi:hypothetical protein V7S43_017682 [Phytophthora oleae]|uniref:Phosphoribosyltransferase domain-containing protein n=1 Tax=Phytophthora oleae TaxID=2107226 RepID=A0ABD3ESI5_9STRA